MENRHLIGIELFRSGLDRAEHGSEESHSNERELGAHLQRLRPVARERFHSVMVV